MPGSSSDEFEILGTEKTIGIGGTLYANGRGVYKRLIVKRRLSNEN